MLSPAAPISAATAVAVCGACTALVFRPECECWMLSDSSSNSGFTVWQCVTPGAVGVPLQGQHASPVRCSASYMWFECWPLESPEARHIACFACPSVISVWLRVGKAVCCIQLTLSRHARGVCIPAAARGPDLGRWRKPMPTYKRSQATQSETHL